MELLYVWINDVSGNLIEKQGINFSAEYDFKATFEEERLVLSVNENWTGYNSIFKTDVIENITAVVGKNGSGKTTLLKYLSGLNCAIPHKDNRKPGYEELYDKELRESLCVLVFRIDEDIVIYHDFEHGFINNTPFDTVNMSDPEVYRACLLNQSDFKAVLKIYVTNSGYTDLSGITQQGKLDELYLTPAGLSTVSASYFEKIFCMDEGFVYRLTPYRKWREIIRSVKKSTDFQQICDVLYFNRLQSAGKYDNYAGKISTKLKVNMDLALAVVDKEWDKFSVISDETDPGIIGYISQLRQDVREFFRNIEEPNPLIKNLYVNLICEICAAVNGSYPASVCTWDDLLEWFESVKSKLNVEVELSYFETAIEEMMEIESILRTASFYENVVPESDLAYDSSQVFDYSMNSDLYFKFISFVANRILSKYSFVLRYIRIENLEMSSGERAFQNIFSWIDTVPVFYQIHSGLPVELKDNILLLIDELDLYLHPEWQRKFIKLLTEEIETQFAGHRVQIIFATHSPLCLSDIPRENTVYLRTENGKCKVDERMSHEQTFGRDIYTLFNDAFFLDDVTMGEYAQSYINGIIYRMINPETKIAYELSVREIEELEKRIARIGNPALRMKLSSMLLRCQKNNVEKLHYLRWRQNQIAEEIARLEAEDD